MSKMNAVGWFDIYVNELERAVQFYEAVLECNLEPLEDPSGETHMMSFPADMNAYGAGGALTKSEHFKPGIGGTVVYFSVEDCSVQEARIEDTGGKIMRSKFSIGEFGWVVLCQDSEGNLIGFNSLK